MNDSTPFLFLVEILPEDASDADPALISALGRDITAFFREQGNTIEPIYTGERGGEFLTQIGTLLTAAWTNKELILSDLSALMSILTPLMLAAHHLWQAYEQRVGKDDAKQHPLTITIEINGVTMKVEALDHRDVQIIAAELAQQFQEQQAAGNPSGPAHASAKIQASVPKRPTRKRR